MQRSLSSSQFRGLIVLNAVLLAVLAAVTFGPRADAQARALGEYTMVGGGVNGSESGAIYIVDIVNREMMALRYDHNAKRLAGVGYRNLASDAASVSRRGGN